MAPQGLIYRGETNHLNAETRSSAPGEFVELADGFVHYELGGSAGAQTVVLVSGLSLPYQAWEPTFKALVDEGFQVLRYDLYGRGFSDRPDARYDRDFFDRQLTDLLDALGIQDRIDLVGLSLGGAISVHFANQHAESLRKLCLIDPAGLPWGQSLPARLGRAPVLGELMLGFLGEKVLISNFDGYFAGTRGYEWLKQEFIVQMQFYGFKRALLSTLRSGIITGGEADFARLGKSDCQVCLIWGRQDAVVPFELSEEVKRLIPGVEFHAIDGAAHIPHYERPEVVNPILINFLKS